MLKRLFIAVLFVASGVTGLSAAHLAPPAAPALACGGRDNCAMAWDPTLYQQIAGFDGSDTSSWQVSVAAVPANPGEWNASLGYPEVATGVVSADGYVLVPDLSDDYDPDNGTGWESDNVAAVDTDAIFVNPSDQTVNLQVSYSEDGGDTWTDAFQVPYAFTGASAGSYDSILLGKQLTDDSGDPVGDQTVALYAEPLSTDTDDAAQVEIGTGTSDQWGYIESNFADGEPSDLVGNGDYATDNGVIQISAQYTDDSGTHEGLSMPYFIGTGGQPDPRPERHIDAGRRRQPASRWHGSDGPGRAHRWPGLAG
jgi:hypothetical protein